MFYYISIFTLINNSRLYDIENKNSLWSHCHKLYDTLIIEYYI